MTITVSRDSVLDGGDTEEFALADRGITPRAAAVRGITPHGQQVLGLRHFEPQEERVNPS